MSHVGQQPGEGISVLVADDEDNIRNLLEETLKMLDLGVAITMSPSARDALAKLASTVVPQIVFLDWGEFIKDPEGFMRIFEGSSDRQVVLAYMSGYNYQDEIKKRLEGIKDKLTPHAFVVLFLHKTFRIKDVMAVVNIAVGQVATGDKLDVTDAFYVVGKGSRDGINADMLSGVGSGNVFKEVARLVRDGVQSISVEASAKLPLYESISSYFVSRYRDVFEVDPIDNGQVQAFLSEFLEPRFLMVLSEALSIKKGGGLILDGITHDLANLMSYPDKESKSFFMVVKEQLAVLHDAFETGEFVENVCVAEFVRKSIHSDEGPHNRAQCSLEDDVCVQLPKGGLGFIVGNLFRNFQKVIDNEVTDGLSDDTASAEWYNSRWFDIDVEREDDFVVIRVSDNAPCFPNLVLESLFERKLRRSGTNNIGSGRALFTMANMLDRFGGSITLIQRCEDDRVVCKDRFGFSDLGGFHLPEGATKEFEIRLPIFDYSCR